MSASDRPRLRLAFVGQATYFRACSLLDRTGCVDPTFVDFRAGADPGVLAQTLRLARPHIVVCFRPELIPPGLFADVDAITVGYLTEPLPRPGQPAQPDLERRLADLQALDAANFDRILSFDPLMVETVERLVPVWRSVPLPVADRFFAPVGDVVPPGRVVFVGRSTAHRESFLVPCKHEFDLLHVAHGVSDDQLGTLLAEYPVAVNLHNEAYPTFENRVALHLAAGQLVISEPLSPTHGLEPGIDFVQVVAPGELLLAVATAYRDPAAFRRIRLRGRRKAEYFRASTVWPRLVGDLLTDIRVYGRGRRSSLAGPRTDGHLPADVEEERAREREREQLSS